MLRQRTIDPNQASLSRRTTLALCRASWPKQLGKHRTPAATVPEDRPTATLGIQSFVQLFLTLAFIVHTKLYLI